MGNLRPKLGLKLGARKDLAEPSPQAPLSPFGSQNSSTFVTIVSCPMEHGNSKNFLGSKKT